MFVEGRNAEGAEGIERIAEGLAIQIEQARRLLLELQGESFSAEERQTINELLATK